MALFGKKKTAEQTAPPVEEQDEIRVVGGDADELDGADDNSSGQVIDFDAIASELEDDESALGQPLSIDKATAATAPDDFAATADFGESNDDMEADDLDFNSVFDDGSPAATVPIATIQTDENPFGAAPMTDAPMNEMPASGGIAIEPVSDTPPMTHTAPLLTSDAVATAGTPATRKSFPLPLMLGALGLLLALGAVGYLVTRGNSDETPVVATNPPLRASSAAAEMVLLRASVDGVPIAPGAVRAAPALTAPALTGPKPTVPLTPALLNKLKGLWKQGAAAKKKGDIAGARAAWTEMLKQRPNHPGVQSAIDQL